MSDGKTTRLHLVSDQAERRSATVWRCPVCTGAGHASGPVMPIALDATLSGGEVKPGEPAFACLACHRRGVLTIVS